MTRIISTITTLHAAAPEENNGPSIESQVRSEFRGLIAGTQSKSQSKTSASLVIESVERAGYGYAETLDANLGKDDRSKLAQALAVLRQAEQRLDHRAVIQQLYTIAILSGLPPDGNVYDYFADKVLRDAAVIGDHLDVRDANHAGYRAKAEVMRDSLLIHAAGGPKPDSSLYQALKSQLDQLIDTEQRFRRNRRAASSAMHLVMARFNALGQDGEALLAYVTGLNQPDTAAQRQQVGDFRQAMNMVSDPQAGQAWATSAFGKTPPEQFMLGLAATFIPSAQDLAQGLTRLTTDPGRVLQEIGRSLAQAGKAIVTDPRGLLTALYAASERQADSSAYARGIMTGILANTAMILTGAGVGTKKIVDWARYSHVSNSLANMGEDLLRIARNSKKLRPQELVEVQRTIGRIRKIEQAHPVGDWITRPGRLQRLYKDALAMAQTTGRSSGAPAKGSPILQLAPGLVPSPSHPSHVPSLVWTWRQNPETNSHPRTMPDADLKATARFFSNSDLFHPDVHQFNRALNDWASLTSRAVKSGNGSLPGILNQIEPLAGALGRKAFGNTEIAANYGNERTDGRRTTEVTHPRFDKFVEPTLAFVERDWANVVVAATGEQPAFPVSEFRQRLYHGDPQALDLIHVSTMHLDDQAAVTALVVFSAPKVNSAYPFSLTTVYPGKPESIMLIKALLSRKWEAMQTSARQGEDVRKLAADFMYDYSRLYWHILGTGDIGTALIAGFMDAFGHPMPELKPMSLYTTRLRIS